MFYIRNNDRKKDLGLMNAFNNLFSEALSKDMKTNIEETEKDYILTAELPGIDKESINITVDNGTLSIDVNQKGNKEEKNKTYLVKERTSISITRSFYLDQIDENNIKAKMDNGILTLTIGKLENNPDPKRVINID